MGLSSLLGVTSRVKEFFYAQPTLSASQVPLLYREPGVESGYRPAEKSWFYYVLSTCQVNNETVNVWTHFLAFLVFLHTFFFLPYTVDGRSNDWPFVAFGICVTTCVLLSTCAHTFHSKSPHFHYICYQLDYLGIGLNNMGSNSILLYTGCPVWLYRAIQPYYTINIVLGWVFMIGNSLAKLKYKRPYSPQRKVMQLVSGVLSVAPGLTILFCRLGTCLADTDCSLDALSHHGRWFSSLLLCLFFFSSHIPEALYPGRFDFIGQSHQIFHVFQAASRTLQYEAGHVDMLDGDLSHSELDEGVFFRELSTYVVYVIGCVVIMVLLKPAVDKRVKDDKKAL